MEDTEHFAKALYDLRRAVLNEANTLGVDEDENWLRAALIAQKKLGYRIDRFMEEKGTDYAFLFPLLAVLKNYDTARSVYVRNFIAQERDSLDQDVRSLGMFCREMSGAGIALQTLLEPMLAPLEEAYGVRRETIIADVEKALI